MNPLSPTQKKVLDLCIEQLQGLYQSNDIKSPSIAIEMEDEWKKLGEEFGISMAEFDSIMWEFLKQIRKIHGK